MCNFIILCFKCVLCTAWYDANKTTKKTIPHFRIILISFLWSKGHYEMVPEQIYFLHSVFLDKLPIILYEVFNNVNITWQWNLKIHLDLSSYKGSSQTRNLDHTSWPHTKLRYANKTAPVQWPLLLAGELVSPAAEIY